MTTPRTLLHLALAASALAACATSAPSPTPGPTATPPAAATPHPTPTSVPGGGAGGGDADPGQGGGTGGSGGTGGATLPGGLTFPLPPARDDTLLGQASYVVPTSGLVNQHAVNVQLVRAAVAEDGRVFAELRWWSGVAPCSQLDSVQVAIDAAALAVQLTVIEGSGRGDIACIEIAELHATVVDLGALGAGTWTIAADGDAPAIELDVA